MVALSEALAPFSSVLILIAVSLGLIGTGLGIASHLRLRSLRKQWGALLQGADGRNLEHLLLDSLRQNEQTEAEIAALDERLKVIEGKFPSAKRYVGLVRYDAFGDVGGNQSFSLAIYDELGNGMVLTSQVGRADCRVFGKQLLAGKSEYSLSVEEERAIEAAASSRARPRISS